MLTDLQLQVARIVLRGGPDPALALAGGAALISWGLVDRSTMDLDLFTTSPDVTEVIEWIEAALRREGLHVDRQQMTPTFARLVVGGDEGCRIDVAQDARMMPPIEGPLGPTIAAEELAADKVLALFSRALGRDFVDVYFLVRLFGRQRVLRLAAAKDRGFDEAVFLEMLRTIERLDREEFDVDDATYASLLASFAEWRAHPQ